MDFFEVDAKTVMQCVISSDVNEQKVCNKLEENLLKSDVKVRCYTLKHVDMEIFGMDKMNSVQVSGLVDSGTEMPMVNQKCVVEMV